MAASSQGSEFAISASPSVPVSKRMLWTGRVISAIPVLLLILSAVMKIIKAASVVQGFARYGYPESQIVMLGVLELLSCVVYAIPRTAVLGAILMTAYLGGATASNVRIGDPSYVMTVLLGVFVWGGLYLRDARVRALIPLRS
ncbi:MAG TPA: DoxX family protein [Candidatus Acidoferrum sp.]|nr:DoxX family protein [Candidatus Acidoferrum sp.]